LLSIDNAAGSYPSVSVDGLSLNLVNDTHNYRDTRDNDTDPVPLMPIQAILWNFRGDVFFGEFTDPFDVVIYGKKGLHRELTELESRGRVHKYCDLFQPFNPKTTNKTLKSVYGSPDEFNKACTSTDGCYTGPNMSYTCLNSSLLYPQQDLMLIDGSDFFDIAADRFRCFDLPSLSCNFNYMVPVGVGIGYIVLYLSLKTMFKGLSYYKKEECIDITQTLEEVGATRQATPAPPTSSLLTQHCSPLGCTGSNRRERKSGHNCGFLGIPRQASSKPEGRLRGLRRPSLRELTVGSTSSKQHSRTILVGP